MTAIDLLREELKQLKDAVSDARKKGEDMLIAALKMDSIPSKIKMAEATGLEKDAAKAKVLLTEVWAEIGRRPVKESFKNTPDAFPRIQALLGQAREAQEHGDKATARELYKAIQPMFLQLDKEQKAHILPLCQQLLKDIR